MSTIIVSTQSISEATRLSLLKAQARLIDAQKEAATGRHADVGRSLGFRTGQTISLRQDHARLTTTMETNAIAATRLDVTQGVLQLNLSLPVPVIFGVLTVTMKNRQRKEQEADMDIKERKPRSPR